MKLAKKYPALGSSADPNKLSLTIKGALVALVPIIVLVLKGVGLDVTEVEILDIINQGFVVVSSVMVFAGLARKLYNKNRVK